VATVLTLAGAYGLPQVLELQLGGEVTTGNTVVPVTYNNIGIFEANVVDGVENLDDAINGTAGVKVVFAHSLGAVVATRWLNEYGPTSTVPPEELSFILIGNPARRYNGILNFDTEPLEAAFGGDWEWLELIGDTPIPVDTPYTVQDLVWQYDGFGDWPNLLENTNYGLAVSNAILGMNQIHANYINARLNSPNNRSFVEGNVTYTWVVARPWWQFQQWLLDLIEFAYDRPVDFGVVSVFAETFRGTDHDDFALWAREVREYRIERAYDRPKIMLYDGDWVYRGTVYGEIAGNLTQIVNETGLIQLRLPIDLDEPRRTWAAFWALDEESRGTSNIHIRVETMGARICGRMKPKNGVTVKRGEEGDEVIIDFLDDIEELKFVHTAGNPFLPISLIQQPKAWMMLLQADHAILLTAAANLLRLSLTNIDIGSLLDLLDPDNWTIEGVVDALLGFWQQSQIVIKPRFFGDSAAPLALVVGSIRTSIFDVAAPILEDAELQWDLQRWFTGDPEPWPGATTLWRSGTLFVDIVDKSGFRSGTSLGGNLLTGLTRTIASVLSNHVEDSYDLFTGETIDETGYRLPGFLGTQAPHPYVVYRDGDITGIQTSEFARSPGGAGRITVGGQSMPGVDELISAAIHYGGDVLGDNLSAVISAGIGYQVSVGSLGGAIDSFLYPIYSDSILAFMSVPLLLRTAKQGWGHYLETTSTNVTQAYTVASVMDLRRRRRETDEDTAFTLQVANASPWLIGANGAGHWWLGDRVGGTSRYLMPRVFVRRCRQLALDWGESQGLKVEGQFGDTRIEKDAIEKMTEVVASAMSGLQQIGLWIVLFLAVLVGVTQLAGYADSQPAQPPQVLAASHYDEPSVQEFASTSLYSLGNTPSSTA
jgi:PE-PPE domain